MTVSRLRLTRCVFVCLWTMLNDKLVLLSNIFAQELLTFFSEEIPYFVNFCNNDSLFQ